MKKIILFLMVSFLTGSVFADALEKQSVWDSLNETLYAIEESDYKTAISPNVLADASKAVSDETFVNYSDFSAWLQNNYGSTAIDNKGIFSPTIPLVPNGIDVLGSGEDFQKYLNVSEQDSSSSLAIVRNYIPEVTGTLNWYRHKYTVTVPKSGLYDLTFYGLLDYYLPTMVNPSWFAASDEELTITGSSSINFTKRGDSNSLFRISNIMMQAGSNEIRISGQSNKSNSYFRSYIVSPTLKWSASNSLGGVSNTPFSGFGGGKARGGGAFRIPDVDVAGSSLHDPITNTISKTDFIDEANNKISLADGVTYDMSTWTYDYNTRTYNVITTDNRQISIKYGDTNVTTTIYGSTGDNITYNYNYITINNSGGGSSSSSPSGGGSSSSTPTDPDHPTDPDTPSIWDKLFGAIGKLISSILKGILDILAQLISTLLDGVIAVIENLFKLLQSVVNFGGEFPEFLKQFFAFLPDEIIVLLCLMFTLSIAIIIIKFFVK